MARSGVVRRRRLRKVVVPSKLTVAAVAVMTVAAGAAHASANGLNLAAEIGKPIKPFARLTLHRATLRTPEQMEAFQAAHPQLGLNQPAHRPGIPMGQAAYREAKMLAAQKPGGNGEFARTDVAPPPASPTKLILKADGPSQSDAGNAMFPPDISGAVGGGQVVVAVNSTFNVYSRSGQSLLHEGLNSLMGTSQGLQEPRVLYDPLWQRWIVATMNVQGGSTAPAVWLAVSRTANARGAYWVYHVGLPYGSGDTYDYPMVGMTQDGLAFTANYFSGGTFQSSAIYAVPKAMVYNGKFATSNIFMANKNSGTLAPPIVLDDKVNAYFMGPDLLTGIDLYKGTNLNSASQYNFVLQAQIGSAPEIGVPPDAQQHNSTQLLDTLDGRFQSPSYQYGTSLLNTRAFGFAGYAVSGFYNIDTSTNSTAQFGEFKESNTSFDFNPSLAANANGEFIVTWSSTDPSAHNARIRYSGWQPGDSTIIGPGTLLETSGPALSGNTESTNLQAWGAYSTVALDANSFASCSNVPNRRALILNERIVDRNTWGTEMGIVGFC